MPSGQSTARSEPRGGLPGRRWIRIGVRDHAGAPTSQFSTNKAFTREPDSDDQDDSILAPEVGPPVPFKNYITTAGYKRLNDELTNLWGDVRSKLVETITWAVSNGDRSKNGDYIYGKRKLREIDRRIRALSKPLDSAVVVDNAGREHDYVYSGETVTVDDDKR